MSTPYRRGYSFELRTMEKLEKQGAVFTARTAGSHTPVDVFAFWPWGEMWFCQCKSGKTKVSRKEKTTLIELAKKCQAVPVLVTRGLSIEML